jgi:hypothetical protein
MKFISVSTTKENIVHFLLNQDEVDLWDDNLMKKRAGN